MTVIQDALPPGPYRFAAGETADTYLIFAAESDKPMVEMIYIGGGDDYTVTAGALAQLFAAAPSLFVALCRYEFLMFRSSQGDHEALEKLADAAKQAGEALIEAVGVEEEE